MANLAYTCRMGFLWIFAMASCYRAAAQAGASPAPRSDSSDVIHLISAKELMGIQHQGKDSSQYQKLTGNVQLSQGQTIFSCDSALQNLTLNTIDAYGHIHINQADTINTYSDYLHYEANTRIATLKNNVRMTDGQMVLTTNVLNYDMNTHVGSYLQGGKLVTGSTVLTSERGYYFADTKDVYFRTNVQLTDPEYTLATDTLLYNTISRIANFVAPTTINTGGSIIHTSCGFYNTLEHFAHLCDRSTVIDSTQRLTADSLNFSRNTGIGEAFGHVVWTDTSRHMKMLSNYAISNQNNRTILATQNPLMILERKTDTLFLAADTLFSGPLIRSQDTTGGNTGGGQGPPNDAAGPAPSVGGGELLHPLIPTGIPDSLRKRQDSLLSPAWKAPPSALNTVNPDSIAHDTARGGRGQDRTPAAKTTRAASSPPTDTVPPGSKEDTTNLRYVMAFHHVRIYSDSLQGVSDSLYYSDLDSAFHFYTDPILWTGPSQLTGDTIVMITRDQHADQILLQQHAMIINEAGPSMFNQIKGTNITGYFTNNNQLDWMTVNGNAETMYYGQDDNGAYVGANRSTSAKIHMYFKDGHLDKVVLLKDVDGSFIPPTKIPEEDRKLRGFRWQQDRRPKSRADLRK